MTQRGIRFYTGIFLISVAALTFEITLTRILSVAFWHHLAFLIIGIALFGIASSGTFLTIFPLHGKLEELLTVFSILFSATAIGGYAVINALPFDPFKFFLERTHIIVLLLYYLLLSVPFFFFGLCVALSFQRNPEYSGKIYFANLLGSSFGAVLVLALFSPLGGSGTLVFSSIIGLSASIAFSSKRNLFKSLFLASLLTVLFLPTHPLEINMSPYKTLNLALRYPDSRILSTDWNAISKIDVFESGYVRYAPGLSLSYQEPLPKQLGIAVDGASIGPITEFRGKPLEFTSYLTSTLPYKLIPGAKVLIIESGGGLEIIQALSNNASEVTVLESNPLIIETLRNLDDFSSVYSSPEVEVKEAEARSYLLSSKEKYDLIEIGLSLSAPASSTGVYALTENYLFTVEAFKLYFEHLTEDGVLSITRPLEPPPRESLKILSIALTALSEMGVDKPEQNIAAIRSLNTITILSMKTGFSDVDLARIRNFGSSRRFDLVYVPGISENEVNVYSKFPMDEYYHSFKELIHQSGGTDFQETYLFDVRPSRDESPFFFHFFRPGKIHGIYRSVGEKWQIFLEGGFILYLLFTQALFLCLLFIFTPLIVFKTRKEGRPRGVMSLLYFFLIGLGFMFLEIPLIQKFILYLGKPILAISSVLFGLLLFSGFGSLYTTKTHPSVERLRYTLVLLVATIFVYLFLLPNILGQITTANTNLRYLMFVFVLAPLGFIMGMPLPTGVALLKYGDHRLIPWAWAANGSASVLGSILAVLIALGSGFSQVMALGALSYAGSLAVLVTFFGPHLQEEQTEH
jgi:hypothetical protein